MPIQFAHTNIIAKDWKALARFYEVALGCTPQLPELVLSGDWLDDLVGLSGSSLRGINLRVPGHGDTGPTLEILTYENMPEGPVMAANTPGLAHLAFAVDDVEASVKAFLDNGGSLVGKPIVKEVPGAGRLSAAYARDPEGNIVELLRWD
ncbi:VOC family protein [Desulfolutivibrio sulfoxidireducens]|uniref:VOC family protein n=1 Tax=Desulfolutivibrio sulfoxidireducens TaxID=2773299 RepID=UPI00159E1CBF|nr:VOC family protein [Desulfolutivibrio sulfoxidireducens]QLA16772.1 VOC family protein [Desulfolutivibrio sulfoxidireducens]QLA20336.1 VOC family protein [Desulfolutivibrio sulfoxidireducens]